MTAVSTADCQHELVHAYRFDDPKHESYGRIALWACSFCRLRFEPRDVVPVMTPLERAGAQALAAGTHEPAVDDFGTQYLAPVRR